MMNGMASNIPFMSILALLTGVWASPLSAQEMGQGEANITAQADVRLALESGPGTNGSKLQDIGGAVGSRLSAVRECYRDVVRERPTVQGTMRLLISVDDGGQVELSRDEVGDETLARCVVRALRSDALGAIRPPGAAYATLTFSNSAAAGVEATQARRAVEDDVDVQRNGEGNLEARGGNATGEVSFRVEGIGRRQSEEQVAAMQRSLRAAIPILLDCRRKAARRSSPAGDIELLAVVPRRGRARIQVRRSSVEDERGGRCLTRFLGRHSFEEAAAGRVKVHVTFTGAGAIPVHREEE